MITSLATKWHPKKIIYSIDDFLLKVDTYKRTSSDNAYVYNDFLVEFDSYLKRCITSNVSL